MLLVVWRVRIRPVLETEQTQISSIFRINLGFRRKNEGSLAVECWSSLPECRLLGCERGDFMPSYFAATLKRIREQLKLSKSELARRSGVAVETIRNWENDRCKKPHEGNSRRVADVLGVPYVRFCPKNANLFERLDLREEDEASGHLRFLDAIHGDACRRKSLANERDAFVDSTAMGRIDIDISLHHRMLSWCPYVCPALRGCAIRSFAEILERSNELDLLSEAQQRDLYDLNMAYFDSLLNSDVHRLRTAHQTNFAWVRGLLTN